MFGSDNQWFKGKDDVLKIDQNQAEAHALYLQLRPEIAARAGADFLVRKMSSN